MIPLISEQAEQGAATCVEFTLLPLYVFRVHADSLQRFVFALFLQPLGYALVAPKWVVHSGEEEYVVEPPRMVYSGPYQFHLIFHLDERAPANVYSMFDEMDVPFVDEFLEGSYVALLVNVDKELGVGVQSPDEAGQLWRVGVCGDEVGYVHWFQILGYGWFLLASK